MPQKTTILTIVLIFLVLTSCTDTSFDSEKWKNWDIKKSETFLKSDMANDLIDNHILKGKTKKEIKDLLGEPDKGMESSTEQYYYDLGPCRGIDYGSLYVKFKNGKVAHVKKQCN